MAKPIEDFGGRTKTPTTPIDPYYLKDPITGLSPAQAEARAAQTAAKTGATQIAAATGGKIDPKTGMVIPPKTTGPSGPIVTGVTYTAPDGTIFTDLNAYNAYIAKTAADAKQRAGQSAYDLLRSQFDLYGLGDLISPLQDLITEGISAAEMTLKLRNDPKYNKAYKIRFAANDARIAKGLRALDEATYIRLEDQYQEIMRNYGLPESYYARGQYGKQPGFEKLIANDVSNVELEDRLSTAYNRVINAAPQVSDALKKFYPEITNGDILAYVLDPENSLGTIKRKVTISEIGGAAFQRELGLDVARASELARYGVTGEQARAGYQAIAGVLPRASTLADIYAKQGLGPYTQTTAEQEVFGLPSSTEATQKRQKLTELEQAQFSGRAGPTSGALGRERAGQF